MMFKKKNDKVKITEYKCRRCHCIVLSEISKRYCPSCQKIVDEARNKESKDDK